MVGFRPNHIVFGIILTRCLSAFPKIASCTGITTHLVRTQFWLRYQPHLELQPFVIHFAFCTHTLDLHFERAIQFNGSIGKIWTKCNKSRAHPRYSTALVLTYYERSSCKQNFKDHWQYFSRNLASSDSVSVSYDLNSTTYSL